jgi:hypothetical protein
MLAGKSFFRSGRLLLADSFGNDWFVVNNRG